MCVFVVLVCSGDEWRAETAGEGHVTLSRCRSTGWHCAVQIQAPKLCRNKLAAYPAFKL